MEQNKITMPTVLERLKEWKVNTDIDIKNDWITEEAKADYTRQSTQLAIVIGILSTIGENNNIPY